MVKIPNEIVDPAELASAVGMREKDLDMEFVDVSIDRKSLIMNLDVKLNFIMPKKIENSIKSYMKKSLGSINGVRISYTYESAPEKAARPKESSSPAGTRRRRSDADTDDSVIFGRKIRDEQVSFGEVFASVENKGLVTTGGEVFSIDSRPVKNGRYLVQILIGRKVKALCIKAFLTEDEMESVNTNLAEGDEIIAQGHAEYDSYEHEIVFMAKSVNKGVKKIREDRHEGPKRVELHVHTRMSDNDGFNDVEELVKTAAAWGQPAVAVTDHGVVQAFPDAAKTAKSLEKKGKKIKIIYGMEGYLYPDEDAIREDGSIDLKKHGTYHIILIAKNLTGLKNLYKIVSYTHIDYFYKKPRLPRSVLQKYREGIIVGSACEAGEMYRAVLNGLPDDELVRIASFYDYLEIQPLGNNQFLIDEGRLESKQDLIDNNLKILEIGDRAGKPVVATTDSHYPDRESSIYRDILMAGIGFKETGNDSLYLRTTDEMLEEFSYLGDRAEEVVITNTNRIADMTEEFQPVPAEKYPPHIDGAEERLMKTCYERAKSIYGDPLPEPIETRLDTELSSIIDNGYAVMYVAAQMLVEKSLSDGYLVGSRGSVGSSFAATMAGITEVNPLPPHYICPNCKELEFTKELDKYDCGFDMPDKVCPKCGTKMKKDGLNIPFATFLGFNGTKEPDIDLNFAGEYQSTAQRYVGVIFGEKNIFKAGTVATVADKTAYGYVMHYLEDRNMQASKYDVDLLTRGCTGVKRTTGQHPGGIIVVPDDHEIFEFCPIQKPANKRDTDVITTHFDYHKIDKNLLKLDILGHDVPQMIRHLQDMTGIDPLKIDLGDKKTLSIFTSIDALGIKDPDYRFVHGTYAIPEFGTNFTRAMLDDIRPTTISALIKISGFSHGTDVWTNNAQDLIRNKTATIDELISCRDDIMNYLMLKGVENSDAFRIMEDVRKNRELKEDELEIMKSHGVPDWYVQSCKTLKYLFPRAHAAAYVMMAIRMAWFKVYYPSAFYCAWLSTKIDNFDIECAVHGKKYTERAMDGLYALGNHATAKQKEQLTVYEVIYELFSRGCEFMMPQLGVSDPCMFNVVDDKINIPFMAVSGVGKSAAESLSEAYAEKPFASIDEAKRRTKLSATNIDDLKKYGVFDGIPDSAQISIFDL
jgi:DNA polymerase-3 subunit alpha (Gram-positive type)